jgi:hypothetical protein
MTIAIFIHLKGEGVKVLIKGNKAVSFVCPFQENT